MGFLDKLFGRKETPDSGSHTVRAGAISNEFEANYFIGNPLGTGAFAIVKEAIRKSDSVKFAVKIVDKTKVKGQESLIAGEIAVLKQLNHPNIVTLVDLYTTPQSYYLVMNLATGGELFDRILAKGSYTEKDAARIISQILEALAYLHNKNIVHRDLKPENVIFESRAEDSRVLLTDFGLSKTIKSNAFLTTSCGTPHYVPPEILKDYGHGTPVDMWSLGVITYVLLSGYTPFWGGETNSTTALYQSIVEGKYEFDPEYWGNISSDAKDFISKLLLVDPSARMTANVALLHPWLNTDSAVDLLPVMRKNFDAKKTFKKALIAITTIRQASIVGKTKSQTDVNQVPEI
ncbi:hypothetical protein BASA61_006755 [Batrachochytrium salamandrivorans]|nr:hypothetical protein BASA61_006755 [Batrachochytrium salamandrivorans]KAH9251309.1 hypothetical protein BASA81_010867 [Batrachochytrium salamandrivorans]KAJ1345273.1 hypothetical protein BSLG_000787 [Batrachochytrium salamandrivorans]